LKRKKIIAEDRRAMVVFCPEVENGVSMCSDCWVNQRARVYRKVLLCEGEEALKREQEIMEMLRGEPDRPNQPQIDQFLAGLIGFLAGVGITYALLKLPDWVLNLLEEAIPDFQPKPRRRRRKARIW